MPMMPVKQIERHKVMHFASHWRAHLAKGLTLADVCTILDIMFLFDELQPRRCRTCCVLLV